MRDPDDFVTTENDSRRACVKSIVRLGGGGGERENYSKSQHLNFPNHRPLSLNLHNSKEIRNT